MTRDQQAKTMQCIRQRRIWARQAAAMMDHAGCEASAVDLQEQIDVLNMALAMLEYLLETENDY